MGNYLILAFLAGAIVVTRLFSDIRAGAHRDWQWLIFGLPINILFPASLCAAYWAIDINEWWGYTSLGLAVLSNGAFLLQTDFDRKLSKVVTLFALVALINTLSIAGTLYWKSNIKSSEVHEIKQLDTQFILDRFQAIQQSFESVKAKITMEERDLRESIGILTSKVSAQSDELQTLAKEKQSLARQVDQLKIIRNQSEEAVSALLKKYKEDDEKNRVKDLIVGAVIGAVLTILTGIIFKQAK